MSSNSGITTLTFFWCCDKGLLMRLIMLTVLCVVLAGIAIGIGYKITHELSALENTYKQTESPSPDNYSGKGRKGTKQNPVFVKVLPTNEHATETRRAREDQYEKA